MILFDYGGTLMYRSDFEPANGNKAIYPYISENPHNVSLEEFSEYLLRIALTALLSLKILPVISPDIRVIFIFVTIQYHDS